MSSEVRSRCRHREVLGVMHVIYDMKLQSKGWNFGISFADVDFACHKWTRLTIVINDKCIDAFD